MVEARLKFPYSPEARFVISHASEKPAVPIRIHRDDALNIEIAVADDNVTIEIRRSPPGSSELPMRRATRPVTPRCSRRGERPLRARYHPRCPVTTAHLERASS